MKKTYEELEAEELINKMKKVDANGAIELAQKYSYITSFGRYRVQDIKDILLEKIKQDSNFYSIPLIYRASFLEFAKDKSRTIRNIDLKLLLKTLSDLSQLFIVSNQIQEELERTPKQKWWIRITKSINDKVFKPKFKMQLPK
jgi:hypothetical protein